MTRDPVRTVCLRRYTGIPRSQIRRNERVFAYKASRWRRETTSDLSGGEIARLPPEAFGVKERFICEPIRWLIHQSLDSVQLIKRILWHRSIQPNRYFFSKRRHSLPRPRRFTYYNEIQHEQARLSAIDMYSLWCFWFFFLAALRQSSRIMRDDFVSRPTVITLHTST